MPAKVEAVAAHEPTLATDERAPGHVVSPEMTGPPGCEHAPGHVPGRARVEPLSAEAYAVQFTRSREQDGRFRYLQDLLGHKVGRGDIAKAYSLAVEELIEKIERKRFAASARPRGGRHRSGGNSRYISADVRRAVCQRDKCQCTYVSESGRRCEVIGDLEFDHVKEFARGGEATVDNIRLRCRAHNQHTAERTYGAGFMERKRAETRAKRPASQASDAPPPEPPAGTDEHDVYLALRSLGHRDGEARRALALCADMPDASREDKLRRALKYFPLRGHRVAPMTREQEPAAAPLAVAPYGHTIAATVTTLPSGSGLSAYMSGRPGPGDAARSMQ